MSDAVGYLMHFSGQTTDAFCHGIECLRQPGNIIAAGSDRSTPIQQAIFDICGGKGNFLNSPDR